MKYDSFDLYRLDIKTGKRELVGSGLSAGELRQSLLDRIMSNPSEDTRICLYEYVGLNMFHERYNDISSHRKLVERYLYDAEDEQLVNEWEFDEEVIIVKGVYE